MKVAPTLVLTAIVASMLFGFFSQGLLMSKDIGFNLAILCVLFFAIVCALRVAKVLDKRVSICSLAFPVGVAAFGFAVPDSRGLDTLNLVMVLLSISYFALRSVVNRSLTLVESIAKAPSLIFAFPLAGLILPAVPEWSDMPKVRQLCIGRGALIGCLAAIPFLAVFGNALAQADPVFAHLFSFTLSMSPDEIVQRTTIFVVSSCFLSGVVIYFSKAMFDRMAAVVTPKPEIMWTQTHPHQSFIGPMPAPLKKVTSENEYVAAFVTFFGLLAAMFLCFVLIQFRYLFGGDAVVLQTEHLSYADYARRGFLEIVCVTAICLPLVIFSQYSLRNLDVKIRKAVNVVVVIVVSLLMLLLASAAFRLKLYVGAYGLSPLRVYVASGMLWLLVLFVAYLRYGTQWKLDKIGKIVYASMVVITLGLNVVRPDYWIARVNLTRREAKSIDPNMIIEAGADAASAIHQFGPTSQAQTKDILAQFSQRQAARSHDWRDLTVSQMTMYLR